MAICECCGNDYDKAFTVVQPDGSEHVFDSYECAINTLAPTCSHCDNTIIGHGMEADGNVYCCAHCARHAGVAGLQDRSDVEDASELVAANAELPEAAREQELHEHQQRAGAPR